MKAIVDADIICYEFGDMKDLETGELLAWPIVRKFVDERIEEILQATEATSYKLYLTDSASNFRNKVATILPYKGHRPSDKPPHWKEIRQHLIDNYDAEVCYGIEADDACGIEQMRTAVENGVRLYIDDDRYTIVDYSTYQEQKKYNWMIDSAGYVYREVGSSRDKQNRKKYLLHKEVLSSPNSVTDHINGNKLDNRSCNLRTCSIKDNVRNSSSNKGSSKFKGVHWDKERCLWSASIKVDRKSTFLGRFQYEEEAALAYDDAAVKYFGEFARLNLSNNHNVPEFEESVICSRDKDLGMIPFLHYSWNCGKQKERKWFVNETDASRFFYKQLLTGDATDNILGLYRVGEKASCVKALDDIDDEKAMALHVISEYKARFGSYWHQFIRENAQLLWIMRSKFHEELLDKTDVLWRDWHEEDSEESSDEASVQDKSSEGQDKVCPQ